MTIKIIDIKLSEIKDLQCAKYIEAAYELLTHRIAYLDVVNEAYFKENDFLYLQQENESFYHEINHEYAICYANPRYTKQILDASISDVASILYYEITMLAEAVFQHNVVQIDYVCNKFNAFVNAVQVGEDVILACMKLMDNELVSLEKETLRIQYTSNNFATKLQNNVDLNDIRYLFRYGIYISESEIKNAELMKDADNTFVYSLAKQMVDCYLKGFYLDNKVVTQRSVSRVIQIVGLEKVAHQIMNYLNELDKEGIIASLVYRNIHPQAVSDYQKCSAFYQSKENNEVEIKAYETALAYYEKELKAHAGNVIMVSFGQNKAEIESYDSLIKANSKLLKETTMKKKFMFEAYVPKAEISYTGMAYPVAEISDKPFKEIFDAIMKINLMDDAIWIDIHEVLIAALNKGEKVHLKGYNGNQTDLMVMLNELEDENTQSNFINCSSASNIPTGEVFTSPKLRGSHGLLHIQKVRLSKIEFSNIKLVIEDGCTKSHSCENTDDKQQNDKLMNDYIFHDRESLPMGEFALGTNTYAYSLAKELGVLYKLHTLIYEKLGPHIAIGDTCFAFSETQERISKYNHKRFVATDNEISIKRLEDPKEAYFGLHYDLTVPYDEIGSIVVYNRDGSTTEIVKDGRIVLAGCEYMNTFL